MGDKFATWATIGGIAVVALFYAILFYSPLVQCVAAAALGVSLAQICVMAYIMLKRISTSQLPVLASRFQKWRKG